MGAGSAGEDIRRPGRREGRPGTDVVLDGMLGAWGDAQVPGGGAGAWQDVGA